MAEYNETVWNGVDKYLDKLEGGLVKESLIIYKRALLEIQSLITQKYLQFGDGVTLAPEQLYQFNRITQLEQQITDIINRMTNQHLETISKGLRENYRHSLQSTYFAVERQIGVSVGIPPIDPRSIETAITTPITGIKLDDTLDVHRTQTIRDIKRTLTTNVVQGKTLRDSMKELEKEFDFTAEKAKRIVITENTRVRNAARFKAMEQINKRAGGGLKKMWVSVKDKKTRKTHRDMDGTIFEMDGDFEIDGMKTQKPGHFTGSKSAKENVNCRCKIVTITPYTVIDRMRAENQKSGRMEVVPYKTYNEWAKANGIE
jgi:SPP1 gp7 family putative phage head morphogenesis protein